MNASASHTQDHECCESCLQDIEEGYGWDILDLFECCCQGGSRD